MGLSAFDIIGPIMIGPSSSHTAGAVRLGQMARTILNQEPVQAKIYLHGSFAETYKGHGTNLAIVAGLLGMKTDDEKIPDALVHAARTGFVPEFIPADLGPVHPNTVRLEVLGREGRMAVVTGSSVGGGRILVTEIDGFPVELSGDYNTLMVVHQDQPGVVAQVTTLLAAAQVNIAQMRVSRLKKGAIALAVLETDHVVEAPLLEMVRRLPAVTLAMAAIPLA
ncbi:MAG TPA: L-serine ammonia-lyase, iron-sulfur-dependent subunit beta [Verrucomicrobiae bacterium]|nr:L-serine ammonia-lyase, iron-sulfur-dependent subunit beta [Verrucomicrobiae bacterium]